MQNKDVNDIGDRCTEQELRHIIGTRACWFVCFVCQLGVEDMVVGYKCPAHCRSARQKKPVSYITTCR